MRTLSLNLREELFARESGEFIIFLLTITHPDLDEPILLTSDATQRITEDPLSYGTVSRGDTYTFIGMEITLPDEEEQSPPTSKMILSNVDRSMIPIARSITSPASVLIEAVKYSDLDTVEFSIPQMQMIHLNYDASQLTFDLSIDALATEPCPSGSFDPASFPGLFI